MTPTTIAPPKKKLGVDDQPVVYIRSADDVDKIIDASLDAVGQRRARRKTLLVMIIALGGVFVDAYDFTSLGVGTVQLQHEFHLSPPQVGLLSATMAISALFGALLGGYFVDKLGRKEMFLLDLWLFVVSAIGAALAPNLVVLVAFRLLMGLGVGLDFPVALSFVVEFCDRARRGLFVNSSYANWYLAALVGFAASYIGYLLGAGHDLWRVAVGFGAVPALILLALRYRYMLESPLWVAHHGDLISAAAIIRKTRNINARVAPEAQAAPPPVQHSSIVKNARILFSKRYRPRAILSAAIGCLQSIEYYAVIFYLPVISQLIFGTGLLKGILGGVIFNTVGLAGSVFQARVCDRTGLRPLTIGGAALAALALLGVAASHAASHLALVGILLGVFMLGHTIGPGPQGMAYAALSFPTPIRGSAVGWAQGMLRVGSIMGFLFFPVVLSAFGFSVTFSLLATAPALILVTALLIRWEPIGVDIEAEAADLDGARPATAVQPVPS